MQDHSYNPPWNHLGICLVCWGPQTNAFKKTQLPELILAQIGVSVSKADKGLLNAFELFPDDWKHNKDPHVHGKLEFAMDLIGFSEARHKTELNVTRCGAWCTGRQMEKGNENVALRWESTRAFKNPERTIKILVWVAECNLQKHCATIRTTWIHRNRLSTCTTCVVVNLKKSKSDCVLMQQHWVRGIGGCYEETLENYPIVVWGRRNLHCSGRQFLCGDGVVSTNLGPFGFVRLAVGRFELCPRIGSPVDWHDRWSDFPKFCRYCCFPTEQYPGERQFLWLC